jgi:hypothetical protein
MRNRIHHPRPHGVVGRVGRHDGRVRWARERRDDACAVEYVGGGEYGDECDVCGGRESDGGWVECVYGKLEWGLRDADGGGGKMVKG